MAEFCDEFLEDLYRRGKEFGKGQGKDLGKLESLQEGIRLRKEEVLSECVELLFKHGLSRESAKKYWGFPKTG